MLLITKKGEKILPLRMGLPENREVTTIIKGINLDSAKRDLFQKRVIEEYHINDIIGFLGSYSFSSLLLEELEELEKNN